jgi:biopolymer transport protein ExbD
MNEMKKIVFPCRHCGNILKGRAQLRGRKVRCPKCGQTTVIPASADEAAPERPKSDKPSHAIPPDLPTPPPPPEPKKPTVREKREPEASEQETPSSVRFFRRHRGEEDLDMTPMVDVTFLLLIFFMVTAAFALQKSIETPPPDREEGTTQNRTIEELEQDDDYIIVRVAHDDTIWVEDREAPTRHELLAKIREIRDGAPSRQMPSHLLVLADSQAHHDVVVMALDAGNAVGMEYVRIQTVDEEDF